MILVVDDEVDIRELLSDHLTAAGFRTTEAADGLEALRLVNEVSPDLILLDLMLPEMDGYGVLQELREKKHSAAIPVIMLTAKGTEDDRIVGLTYGADDYMAKPFSPKELTLRIQAVLRRTQSLKDSGGVLEHSGLRLDRNQLRLFAKDQEIELTATEFKLMLCLMEEPGKPLGRADLLQRVWGYSDQIQTRTLDTHVKRLREKISDPGELIQTVRSVGYRFGPPSADAS